MNFMKRKYVLILWIGLFVFSGTAISLSQTERGDTANSSFVSSSFSRAILLGEDSSEAEVTNRFLPSKAGAFFFSLILPGSGEYYAGSKKMASIFLGSEAVLWSVYFVFRAYGIGKKDDYRSLAVASAGVDPSGKDYDYYIAVENYESIYAYNQAKLRERNLRDMYPEDEAHHWQWDSESSRERFKMLRIASDGAFRNSLYVVGAVVVNHIVSGIDALRLARMAEKGKDQAVHLGVSPLREGGLCVVLCRSF